MQDDNEVVVDGDSYFDELGEAGGSYPEPESNGDATPVGDVDSHASELEIGDEATDTPEDDYDAAEAPTGAAESASDEDDTDDTNEAEWLPGFEGRFRPGDEAKALESYRNLESEYSRRQNEHRAEIEAASERAFERAAQLLQAQKPQQSVVQQLQEQQQLTALAYTNPGMAFKAALQTGDDATIDAVIQAVSAGDPELGIDGDASVAMQMQGVVMQLQQRKRDEERSRELAELRAEVVLKPTAASFKEQYAELLSNEDIASAFQQTLAANWDRLGDTTDQAAVEAVLETSLQQAVGHVAINQGLTAPSVAAPVGEPQQQQMQQRPAKRRPHTEGAGPTRATPKQQPTETDDYGDELLAAARVLKPIF